MEQVTGYYFTQGVLGVTCIVLAWVCLKLYNKTEKLQLEKDVLQKEKEDLIEARRQDSIQSVKDYSLIVQNNTHTQELLAGKIDVVKEGK